MRPVCAVLRIDGGGDARLINVSAGDHAMEMAQTLVESSAMAASHEMKEPGVYRLRIDGEPKRPDITVTKIADPEETVAVAMVERDGEESVAIRDVKLSLGQGAELEDGMVESALTEAVASCAKAIPMGEERAVEIVIPDE